MELKNIQPIKTNQMNWFNTSTKENLSEIDELIEEEMNESSRKTKIDGYIEEKVINAFRSNQAE